MKSLAQNQIETLIIETLLQDDQRLIKNAQSGVISSLVSKVKDYVSSKIDPNDTVGSVINLLTPGILTAFGFPTLAILTKLAQMVFGLDLGKIFSSISSEVRGLISGGKKTSSNEVDNAVQAAVMNNAGPEPTQDTVDKFLKAESQLTYQDAQLFRIACKDFLKKNPDFNAKNTKFAAGLFSSSLATFVSSKNKTLKILIAIIGWIVKTILATAGFMVAEDAINAVIGRPSAFTDTSNSPSAAEEAKITTLPASTQKVLKVSPNYSPENFNTQYSRWIIPGSTDNVDEIVSQWAQEIYPDLQGHNDVIQSTNNFKNVVGAIKAYNNNNSTGVIIIPKTFKSRKQIVDTFIDEIAKNIVNLLPQFKEEQKDKKPGIMI